MMAEQGDVPRRPSRIARFRVAAFLVSASIAGACLDFSTDPGELLYVAFERLPYPAVVVGDTLRDSTGAAVPLSAIAVNASGAELPISAFRFYTVGDTANALEVDSTTGVVVATGPAGEIVRIIAAVGSLQSVPLAITLTRRPDSLQLVVERDTVGYSLTDTTLNFSVPLTARVLHNDSTTFYSPVNRWIVRYSLERLADTLHAALVDDSNRRLASVPSGRFHIDTTGADGTAGRKLRVAPGPSLISPLDSVAVIVEALYRGEHVAGSPARVFVYIRPRITP